MAGIVMLPSLYSGDIVFTRCSKTQSALIRLKDFLNRFGQAVVRRKFGISPFSHVALCLAPGLIFDAVSAKPLGSSELINWLDGVDNDSSIVYRHHNSGGIDAVAGDCIAASYVERFVGLSYNFRFLVEKDVARKAKKSFFCSELVASWLSDIYHVQLPSRPEKVLPMDLPQILESAGWKKISLASLLPRSSSQQFESFEGALRAQSEAQIKYEKMVLAYAAEIGARIDSQKDCNKYLLKALSAAKTTGAAKAALNAAGRSAGFNDLDKLLDALNVQLDEGDHVFFLGYEIFESYRKDFEEVTIQELLLGRIQAEVFCAEFDPLMVSLKVLAERVDADLFSKGISIDEPHAIELTKEFEAIVDGYHIVDIPMYL